MFPRNTENKPELFIICGNNSEFRHYASLTLDEGKYHPVYLNDPRQLRGRRDDNYIMIGNWNHRSDRDSEEMYIMLKHGNHRQVFFSEAFGDFEKPQYVASDKFKEESEFYITEEEMLL